MVVSVIGFWLLSLAIRGCPDEEPHVMWTTAMGDSEVVSERLVCGRWTCPSMLARLTWQGVDIVVGRRRV